MGNKKIVEYQGKLEIEPEVYVGDTSWSDIIADIIDLEGKRVKLTIEEIEEGK